MGLQNPVQQEQAIASNGQQVNGENVEIAADCEALQELAVTKADGEGFDSRKKPRKKRGSGNKAKQKPEHFSQGDAKATAAIAAAVADLPKPIRAAILALVKAASQLG